MWEKLLFFEFGFGQAGLEEKKTLSKHLPVVFADTVKTEIIVHWYHNPPHVRQGCVEISFKISQNFHVYFGR